MADHGIRLDLDDGVATITIDRPDHRNGMTGEMVMQMYDIVHQLARSDAREIVARFGQMGGRRLAAVG